jgi:RNA polymerase sigma-70 factor (ECF subfamily)
VIPREPSSARAVAGPLPGLNPPWDLPTDPLAALRRGDPEPFEAFVRAAAERIVGFFRRLGASPEEAEDLAQEVFLKLHQNAARYRPEERFTSFCFRVARNVWIDARRRQSARIRPTSLDRDGGEPGASLGDSLMAGGLGPAESLAESEDAQRMGDAVKLLPDHHRLVFELGVIQELSYEEIGSILDIPVGTVKSRMFHAVRKLRKLAAGEPALEEGA